MQSDAFPTPPIYEYHFQPRLVEDYPEQQPSDRHLNYLLNEIESLITDCSTEDFQSFWLAADRIKFKHRVTKSMQKIENLFLDLARESTQDLELISAISQSLRYTNHYSNSLSNSPQRKA